MGVSCYYNKSGRYRLQDMRHGTAGGTDLSPALNIKQACYLTGSLIQLTLPWNLVPTAEVLPAYVVAVAAAAWLHFPHLLRFVYSIHSIHGHS